MIFKKTSIIVIGFNILWEQKFSLKSAFIVLYDTNVAMPLNNKKIQRALIHAELEFPLIILLIMEIV